MIQFIEKYREKRQIVLLLIASLLGVYGINYTSALVTGTLFSNGISSMIMLVVIYVMLKLTMDNVLQLTTAKEKKRRCCYAYLFAVFLCALLVAGYQLKVNGATDPGFKGKGLILIRGCCMAFAVLPFTNFLFAWAERLQNKEYKLPEKPWKSRNVFFLSWLVVFMCWIPVFLAYYPAVMSYDFHRQSIEAMKGFIWFNSYQPLAHTWLIWLFFQIGQAFGGYQIGLAFYSIFQMLVFSVACAYSCAVVYRLLYKKLSVTLMTLFFGCFPYISVLSVTVTKDVLFSALFLVFMCLFVERTFLCTGKKQRIMDLLWVLEGIVMMLFRNNAIYAVAVFTIFYLVLGVKKQRLRIIIMCLTLVIGGKLALEGMQVIIGTQGRGSKVEMFSVPIQQFARVGKYHLSELNAEDFELINTYVPEEYWERYNPPISDTVKALVGAYVFPETWKDHYGEMLSAWLKVGLHYPNAYIDAFLELNAGYWFLDDVTWAEVLGYGLEGRMGAVYTYTSSTSEVIPEGIAHESKLPALELALEKIVSANCFYDWPVLSNLFKPAFYCWSLLLTTIAAFYIKERRKILVVLLPLVYLATMFLGPVVQVRYILPIIMIMPMMFAVLVCKRTEVE